MALLLDTTAVAERDRADMIAAAVLEASAPAHIAVHDRDSAVRGRIEGWQFGTTGLVRVHAAGFRMVRTARQIRQSPASLLQISMPRNSVTRWAQGDIRCEVQPGQPLMSDFSRPFEVDWCGGEGFGLQVSLEELGVSTETIRRAHRLQASPLHSLMAAQLTLMADTADALTADPAAANLGMACVEMVRALLISAAGGPGDATALPADILLTQIRDYIRRHLTNSHLTPADIARAHHISVRYLYKICARANFSLHEWTITQRLDHTRRDLADPTHRHRSISTIARYYGFRDPSHFARRFRATYGMTPVEWRHTALAYEPSPNS